MTRARLNRDNVLEVADILAGQLPGRGSDPEITVFESQGISAWDVATAAKRTALAKARGMGQIIPLFDSVCQKARAISTTCQGRLVDVPRPHQRLQRAAQARVLLIDPENLG